MNDVVYVIVCTDDPGNPNGDKWVHSICRESLTADEACDKLNAEAKYTDEYHVEEHEVY